jgi:hypothetical protein
MERRKAGNEPVDREWIVTLAVGYIEESTDEERKMLLADFLCAAWPTAVAQDQ